MTVCTAGATKLLLSNTFFPCFARLESTLSKTYTRAFLLLVEPIPEGLRFLDMPIYRVFCPVWLGEMQTSKVRQIRSFDTSRDRRFPCRSHKGRASFTSAPCEGQNR